MTLTRGLGQSALSVISIAIVGHWFTRRIDTAMAIYSVVLSIGFMVAFPSSARSSRRGAGATPGLPSACALVAGLAPLSWLLVRRSPGRGCASTPQTQTGHTPGRSALRTPAFWIFALGTALYGLVASGIGLFNESILAERGFGADVYYQTLVVTAMTALVGQLPAAAGWRRGCR